MKKHILIAISTVVILGVIAALVFSSLPLLSRNESTALAQTDAAGSSPAAASDAAADTAQAPASYAVVSEGVVVPVQEATLSMAASGIVDQILVGEGETVAAGQVILRLQNTHQQAAGAEAQAAVASAQAQYDALKTGARSQEIASAQANLDASQARLTQLKEGARAEDITAGEAALAAAQATLKRLYDGPDDQTRIAAQADLNNAQAALKQAQAAYDRVANEPNVTMLPQSLQLEQATNNYKAAQARYDELFAKPDADVVANAQAQVKSAQANLDRLHQPATDGQIAEAEAMVRQAQAQLDLLNAGARAEDVAAAAAAVDQAQAGLQQAQASLDDTELRAPFSGTLAVLNIKAGEQVAAGTPIAQVADLSTWQIETDDLTELDVVNVQAGDRVQLTFDAVPGLELGGTVLRIKPLGEEKRGDITYTVVVQPDSQDARLRWKMTATVTIP